MMVFVAVISAISVFPDAVGVQTSKFLPSKSPALTAFSCAGRNSVMFSCEKISIILAGSLFLSS